MKYLKTFEAFEKPEDISIKNNYENLSDNIKEYNSKKISLQTIYNSYKDNNDLISKLKSQKYIDGNGDKIVFINPLLGLWAQVCSKNRELNDIELDYNNKTKEYTDKKTEYNKATSQETKNLINTQLQTMNVELTNTKKQIDDLKKEIDDAQKNADDRLKEMNDRLKEEKDKVTTIDKYKTTIQ